MNRRLLVLIACVFVALLAGAWSAPGLFALASVPEASSPPQAQPTPPGDGPWVIRAYYTERRMVDELATWREPWEVHHDLGYLVLDVDRPDYERLLAAGFRLEIDQALTDELTHPHTRLPGQTAGIPAYPCYRTVEETFLTARTIVTTHPHLAAWIDAGDSWEKMTPNGNDGYDLWVLRLTNSSIAGPKPRLFVMSAVHAREYTTAELNTRFAEYLLSHYGNDPDVSWLLDYHEIHLLLQANPDGRKRAESGLWWRKNTNNAYCANTNSRGADLNRNFQFQWGCCGGSSSYACDENYRGPSLASEPETQVVQNYLRSLFPDQRGSSLDAAAPPTTTGVFVDLHSYGELVLWPWGFSSAMAPNGPALQRLGRKLAYFNAYEPAQAIGLYPTDGTTDDFAYGDLGLAAYTVELGTQFFQDCATFEDTIVPDNLPALLYAAKVARAPYLLPAGPDVLNVSATPDDVRLGSQVRLAATIDDTRYNTTNGLEPSQAISAAEYYIDTPPWVTATLPLSHPLAALDGAFDGQREAVEAMVDTLGLSAGRHTLFVRGQDAVGNWGPFSAVFMSVTIPAYASITDGAWHDGATWAGDVPPTHTDDVIISSGTHVTLSLPGECRDLLIEPGARLSLVSDTLAAARALTVSGVLTHLGWLHQDALVDGSRPVEFLRVQDRLGSDKYWGLVISPTAALGQVQVTIGGNQPCGPAGGLSQTVQRCYDVAPALGAPAVITFYYRLAEAQGNTSPSAWRWNDTYGQWDALDSTHGGVEPDARWVRAAVSDYSPFTLQDKQPVAVALRSLARGGDHWAWFRALLAAGAALCLVCTAVCRREGGE
jgi:carboxypeptidase T